jgi:hypothetical protein
MLQKIAISAVLVLSQFWVIGQQAPFELSLKNSQIDDLGGLQSFAFGQADGKWLLIGGRLDGLHRRQPWASFDIAGHNNQLIVVDPTNKKTWSASLTSLPTSIQEHLSSTNMNFHQQGDHLYIIGGYGFSGTQNDHYTFPYLTAVDVPKVIEAIVEGKDLSEYFRQVSDTRFQVTGGRLRTIYDTFYLLGGQKFLGRYNPMNNPTFTQEYTNQVRRFTIEDDGKTLVINHLEPFTNADELHRRDYNAEPQILPDGEEGITMFSGVFSPDIDLPFLNSVTVDSANYSVNNDFKQYYNHYHCGVIPIYSAASNDMHSVFFGGIAQYYDSSGILVQDNDVPFVNTIARVTRDKNGNMAEYKLPIEMPALLGAGSEFIPNTALPRYGNEVIKLDDLTGDTVFLGYLFGGISSTAANIFWSNNGTQSSASDQLFEIYLIRKTNAVDQLNKSSQSTLNAVVFPNPGTGEFNLRFCANGDPYVHISIRDLSGKLVYGKVIENLNEGTQNMALSLDKFPGDVFFVSLQTETERITRKVMLNR